jgi:hypothetical protein
VNPSRLASSLLNASVLAVLLAAGGAAAAQDIGRLFFTPQQREDLDRRRNTVTPETTAAPVESEVTVNGRVTRSSGKTTTWVNGQPQYDAYAGRDGDRVTMESGDSAVKVRVGQTLDRSRGQVHDVLPDGAITIRRSNAK